MPRYPRAGEPRPPALPPETRTIGQLVAETIRLYGRRFAPALALGLPVALLNQVYLARVDPADVAGDAGRPVTSDLWFLVATYLAAAPLLSLAYAAACRLAHDERPPPRAWVTAVAAGTLAFLPAAFLLPAAFFLAVAWLALVGLVVPVCLLEREGLGRGFRRAFELGRVDYVHAFAGLATVALVYWLTRTALVLLLREQADNTIRSAAFLGDLVLSPLLFLGPALLYADQAARLRARQ
jgi:hypothetical protein